MSSFNPYRHLLSKVTALLKLEARMSPEERADNQWQLLVKFCGTQVTVGKGGVNTIFYVLGAKGQRKLCYPDDILEKLSTLSQQKYWRYEVKDSEGNSKFSWTLDSIRGKVPAARGSKIYGLKHAERVLLHTATKGLHDYEWK